MILLICHLYCHPSYLLISLFIQKPQRKEVSEKGSCSEVLTLFRDVPAALFSSVNKSSSNHGVPSGIEPTKKEIMGMTTVGNSSLQLMCTRMQKTSVLVKWKGLMESTLALNVIVLLKTIWIPQHNK